MNLKPLLLEQNDLDKQLIFTMVKSRLGSQDVFKTRDDEMSLQLRLNIINLKVVSLNNFMG